MIKFMLCITIIIVGVLVGQLKARTYEHRIQHLQSIIGILKVIEAEMKYRLDPLPEIFYRLSNSHNGISSQLLGKTYDLLKQSPQHNFSHCWNTAIDTTLTDISLTPKDLQVLKDIGTDLGKTDMSGQSSLFYRAFRLLEDQVIEADEEKRAKGKMYKSLGPAISILIVIVLI